MTQPRPHAELIKQWADGAKIQYRSPQTNGWVDSADPAFVADYEYRIKPAKVYPTTQMSVDEMVRITTFYGNAPAEGRRALANAALRAAIDAGQVVTREEFDKLSREYERAAKTLTYARFTDHGGELWKPPIGNGFEDRNTRDMAVACAVQRAALEKFGILSDEWKSVEEIDVRAILAKVKA